MSGALNSDGRVSSGGLAALQRFSTRISEFSAVIGMLIVFAVMIFTVLDVALRYLFNSPLGGSVDIMTYGLALAVAAAMPYGFANSNHVRIDVAVAALPKTIGHSIDAIVHLVCAAAMAVLGWRIWVIAGARRARGDRMWILQYETWPLWYAVAAAFWACVFVCLLACAARAVDAYGGRAS